MNVSHRAKLGAASAVALLAIALPSASSADQPIQVFILAGQSNMVGRAQPISAGTGPTANLLAWDNNAWEPAQDPLGPNSEPDSAVGPGMTFGIGVLAHEPPGTTVGLVMCARGSTSISDWKHGAAIYEACKHNARATGGHIAGVVFLQGEHEAAVEGGGATWAKGFAKVEPSFQDDFGPIPFVLTEIGNLDPARSPYQQEVRDAQAAAASAHPEIELVTTGDLAVEGVHFTVDAEKTLGTRMADAWYTLYQRIPKLSTVGPGSGRAGDPFTIRGSGFDITTSVKIGFTTTPYQIDSDGQLTATVPASAQTGPVTVRTPLGIVSSPSSFQVLPTIDSFLPISGKPGRSVKLIGTAFKGTTLVTLNGQPMSFTVKNPTLLKLTVPSNATSGRITVTTAAGTATSAGTFVVTTG